MFHRQIRRKLTHVILASLVLRLVLSVVHLPVLLMGAVEAGAASASGGLQQVVLCTADGLRVVTLDTDGNPIEDDGAPVQVADCAICSLLNSGPPILKTADASVVMMWRTGPVEHILPRTFAVETAPLRLTRGQDPPLHA